MSNRANRKSGNNRRQQTPKGGNRAMAVAMQELRRSSATSPVPSGTEYKRNRKHRNQPWEA